SDYWHAQQQLNDGVVQMPLPEPGVGVLHDGRAGSVHWAFEAHAVVQTQMAIGPLLPQHKHSSPLPHTAPPGVHGTGGPASGAAASRREQSHWHWPPSQILMQPASASQVTGAGLQGLSDAETDHEPFSHAAVLL